MELVGSKHLVVVRQTSTDRSEVTFYAWGCGQRDDALPVITLGYAAEDLIVVYVEGAANYQPWRVSGFQDGVDSVWCAARAPHGGRQTARPVWTRGACGEAGAIGV